MTPILWGVKMGEGAALPHQGLALAARVGADKTTNCPARIPRDAPAAAESADQTSASRTAGLIEFDVRQFSKVDEARGMVHAGQQAFRGVHVHVVVAHARSLPSRV